MRKFKFTQGTYYHICNRSNDKTSIFFDDKDYARFLFFILAYQAPLPFYNLGRQTSYFIRHLTFNISEETINRIVSNKMAELNAFAIMPNHFHLLIQEKTEVGKGTSLYLQRIQTGYAKYFNAKYKKLGHLFQGTFRAIPIQTDQQLLYLSSYIHRNPRGLREWKNKEVTYSWSSYQDFAGKNRWGKLLNPDIILNQFSDTNAYRNFVETSTAKLKPGESNLFFE